jgi:hypothetical protein
MCLVKLWIVAKRGYLTRYVERPWMRAAVACTHAVKRAVPGATSRGMYIKYPNSSIWM